MTGHCWAWAAARSTGTSHLRFGKQCDDYGACLEIAGPPCNVLIAVAADGAGSASHSSSGSRIVTRSFVESTVRHLRDGRSLGDITQDLVSVWLDDARDRIAAAAERIGAVPRDFASTLVGTVIGQDSAVVVHVGDGACVYRNRDDPTWKVATWPAQGEYAATTFFVTDEPQPTVNFATITESIHELAIFSDGIERLALDFADKSAYAPFFEKMFAPLTARSPGRDRQISKALLAFLDGPTVCERTDDDKTLILARRIVE
jgi:Protein phosphatase 2C